MGDVPLLKISILRWKNYEYKFQSTKYCLFYRFVFQTGRIFISKNNDTTI